MYNIYLISAINNGEKQYKIGLSIHPEKRINELKTGNPNIKQIEALYKINNRELAYATEAHLKRHLKDFKIHGEWFSSIILTTDTFFEYCKLSEEIANSLIKIKKNIYDN